MTFTWFLNPRRLNGVTSDLPEAIAARDAPCRLCRVISGHAANHARNAGTEAF
ncbi:MAG: hypothetical protein HXX11_08065 [Desulfuromonadales bacterium]|nr:hypothetical protein [Desulfuromonadales bacterium]